MNAIDTHVHVFRRGLPVVPDARYVPDYDATIESLFALQEANAIDRAVLVQPSFLGTDNTFLLETLAAHPARLRGVVVVNPDVPRTTMNRWDAAGVRGVRFNLVGLAVPDFAKWQRLLAAIADCGWHVEVHATAGQLGAVLDALRDCPAALVFDHFARPDPNQGMDSPAIRKLFHLAERKPVYVKLSGGYRLEGADAVQYSRVLIARLGARRLLWGSDWPWTNHEAATTTYERCVNDFSHWVPGAEDRRRILWDTAASLFRF